MPSPSTRLSGHLPMLLAGGLALALAVGCAPTKKGSSSTWQPDSVQETGSGTSTLPPPVSEWAYTEPPVVPDGFKAQQRVQRVSFGAGSASLGSEARGALSGSMELIEAQFQWHLLLVGFTDNAGEAGKADALARERTDTVRRYLEGRGIDGSRITTMSMGSRYAEGDQYTPETRARDRAVEVWAFRPR